MKIELSLQQEQAVKQGQPVEVLDPESARTFVVVTRELFERFRPFLETPAGQSPNPSRSGVTGPPEGQALRQPIRDLPLPPEVAAEAERHCRRLGLWGAKSRRRLEEQMKFQHYYGGRWVAYLRSDAGRVIVAVAESLRDPLFDHQLSLLSAEERRSVLIDSPPRLFDEESEILTPFSDES